MNKNDVNDNNGDNIANSINDVSNKGKPEQSMLADSESITEHAVTPTALGTLVRTTTNKAEK